MFILLLITTMSILFSATGCAICQKSDKPGDINLYHYRMTSLPAFHVREYELKYSADGDLLLDRIDGGTEVVTYRVDSEVAKKVGEMVSSYKLKDLERSYEPPFQVFDGWMWDLYIKYPSSSISSGGSNALPPKIQEEGINAINAYLDSVAASCSEEDIVGKMSYFDWKRG